MALLHQLFSVEDLRALDAKELDIILSAIQHEIITSPRIREILLERAHQVYSQLRPGSTPTGPTGAEESRGPTGAEESRPRPRPRRRR